MRGRPLIEIVLFLVLAAMIVLPIIGLSRQPQGRMIAGFSSESPSAVPIWFELRLSHQPQKLVVSSGGEELSLDHRDPLRPEGEGWLKGQDGKLLISVGIEWPPEVREAYLEVSLEAGNLPRQTEGFWSRGAVTTLLEFNLEDSP